MCSDPKTNFNNEEEETETGGVDQLAVLRAAIAPTGVVKQYFEQRVFGGGDGAIDPQHLIDALWACADSDKDTNMFTWIDWCDDAVRAIFDRLFDAGYGDVIMAEAKKEWPDKCINNLEGFLDVVCCMSYLHRAFEFAARGVEASIA